MDYISKSYDLPKKNFLMTYISIFEGVFFEKLPKKEILITDVSRPCNHYIWLNL